MNKEHEKFTISQWAALIRENKCLIMRSSDTEYWELPGGRIEVDELDDSTTEMAFRREIREELGITEFKIKGVVDSMIGYSMKSHTPICRLVYLIENDEAEIKLSSEHSEYYWVGLEEVDNYSYSELRNSTKLSDIIKNALEKNY